MNYRPHTTSRDSGITLVEMMVALAITTFVVLVINQLFNSVVTTVARGTQTGEILQKARTLDEQIAFETELQVTSDPTVAGNWHSRMVGPIGRDGIFGGGDPGGFFAVVQRVVEAPLTVEDGIRGETRFIRSDQVVFIYDQQSPLNAPNTRRMPTLAPASVWTYTGDERDSMNADYVRMWYGHVLQLRDDQDPTDDVDVLNAGTYQDIELGSTATGNPNILGQDWVLGRHALFLTDSSTNTNNAGVLINRPYAPHAVPGILGVSALTGLSIEVPNSPRLANGIVDVADITLNGLTGAGGLLDGLPSLLGFQGAVISMMFTQAPLLTSAQPLGVDDNMYAWDVSPTHTYFMGGVSDFIVEWAGDVVNVQFTGPITPAEMGKDGELDRDGQGRIKWYTALGPNNPGMPPNVYDEDKPVTYAAPAPALYSPHVPVINTDAFFSPRPNYQAGNQASFVWQHDDGTAGFTTWPWMIRIRYRLHDRRGDFQGREVTNSAGDQELEPGQWFETIIPVNYQNR